VTTSIAGRESRERTVHVEHCMGTTFTIDIRDPGPWATAIGEVVTWLHRVDATFSTYEPDSDISRIRRGELYVADADPDVRVVLDLCARAQRLTNGYFTSLLHGQLDPTGLVKGWAIERASELLREQGSANHAVNGGGDMQLAGEAAPGRPWTVGINDPANRTGILSTVSGRDFAVATSGTSERGWHILDPFTGRPPAGLAAATVTGPRLTDVDTFATAAFVMGTDGALSWIAQRPGFEVLLVTDSSTCYCTFGWRDRYPVSAHSRLPAGPKVVRRSHADR
jgi:thiamine biosynthesis lipoprotein